MFIPYKYAYLIGSLYFVPVWAWLYLRLPQHRKFMLLGGVSYMWLGFAVEYLWWTKDWWHPMTITGTVVGVEDIIMSFTHVAIPIFIYKYVVGKDMAENKNFRWKDGISRFLLLMILLFGTITVSFYYFEINSFVSTVFGLLFATSVMIYKRKDLFISSVGSAIFLVALTFPVYILGHLTCPGAIKALWDKQICGIIFLGYPIEDLIAYAAMGLFFGIVYEFVADRKIIKLKTNDLKKDIIIIFNFIFHPEKIKKV